MGSLVAEQTTATAVTESLATLIDWVNVRQFSAFRIIVENTGGGTGNDITDVQIDESADGGTTVSTDQHAGVPNVPISTGNSMHEGFTSTAKYLRVRMLCAAGEDTTAKAWLLADTVTGLLCTLSDVRTRLGYETGTTSDDEALYDTIRSVSAMFDSYCNRMFILNAAAATEYYNGDGDTIHLKRYPILSITSVTESPDFDWDNETALTANEGYRASNDKGLLRRISTSFLTGPDTVRVVYTGGYVPPSETAGAGETELPSEIREATMEQAIYIFQRRKDVGLTNISFMNESISKSYEDSLLPLVKAVLNKYRRFQ